MQEQVKKMELDFATARKEIMQLRLENRKLETALTHLSRPMVVSDEEDEPHTKRRRSTEGAIVIALPQGEAQERIDSLLAENASLAAEILQLRQSGGVSSIFEKNKELLAEVKLLESRLVDNEKQQNVNIKQLVMKAEKEARQLKSRIVELEENLSESRRELVIRKDEFDSHNHQQSITLKKLETENRILEANVDQVYETANKIVANVCIPARTV